MQTKTILVSGLMTKMYQSDNITTCTKKILFLHGRMQDGRSFAPFFPYLEKNNFGRVSIDLPGFGGTDRPSTTRGVADYASFVLAVCDKIQLAPDVLIGHSFGGRIAIFLMKNEKGKMKNNNGSEKDNLIAQKLILIGSAGIKQKITGRKGVLLAGGKTRLGQVLKKSFLGSLVKRFTAGRDYKNAGAMQDILIKVVNEDLTSVLPHITAPTLLLRGSLDDQAPLRDGQTMARLIPSSTLKVFSGCGHFVFLEKPEEVGESVIHFLFM